MLNELYYPIKDVLFLNDEFLRDCLDKEIENEVDICFDTKEVLRKRKVEYYEFFKPRFKLPRTED